MTDFDKMMELVERSNQEEKKLLSEMRDLIKELNQLVAKLGEV